MSLSPYLDVVLSVYRRLAHDELVLFLKVRNLPTSGDDDDLASRLAHHDLHAYHFPAHHPALSPSPDSDPTATVPATAPTPPSRAPDLPIELIIDIVDRVGDWELTQALRIPTSLPRPLDWTRASPTDAVLLSGSLPLIRAANLAAHPPSKIGASAVVRFAYIHVLQHLLTHHRPLFLSLFSGDLIPIKASRHARVAVLDWWKHLLDHHPDLLPRPNPASIADAIDGASRNGHVPSLDWWRASGLPLHYTDAALEHASARNHIPVLDWWKHQHVAHALPLKFGRVMDIASTAGHVSVLEWWATSQLEPKYDRHAMQNASCHGKVNVLNWWLGSGLQLVFDQDALTGASRYNRPEVLEWWDQSGLPIQYRMCDIEEALEDAIGGGDLARAWWKKKGVDFTANHREWTKLQNLN